MDDAVQAIIIAFSTIVFVIALSLSVYLITQVTEISEYLAYHADSTKYYDNIDINSIKKDTENVENSDKNVIRYVSAETIIPTLYRYNKENFCVKIYDADNNLIQIFDVNLEEKVRNASADTKASNASADSVGIRNYAYKKIYNDPSKDYYLFGAPWLGNAECVKERVDLFVNGTAGYINNTYVDYTNNKFYLSLQKIGNNNQENTDNQETDGQETNGLLTGTEKQFHYSEQFISYSYTGETMENSDGDLLITGADSKDKIVIIYKLLKNP